MAQFNVDPASSLRVLVSRRREILTPREKQVAALAAEGLSNRDIAGELNLSEHAVKKYLFRIFDKLGISSRVELVFYAVNHGSPLLTEIRPERKAEAKQAERLSAVLAKRTVTAKESYPSRPPRFGRFRTTIKGARQMPVTIHRQG
jgi:DNA-binding CsgD family transcriptional regulator